MTSPDEDPSDEHVSKQCLKLKKQLDDLVAMTTSLEAQLTNPGMSPEEHRNLDKLRMRYALEAVEMMRKIDFLEDPEELGD